MMVNTSVSSFAYNLVDNEDIFNGEVHSEEEYKNEVHEEANDDIPPKYRFCLFLNICCRNITKILRN
ncbi:hypothetical protein ACS0TY_016675 [Phlomoides rotata]